MGITLSIDTKPIDKVIKQINEYKADMQRKEARLVTELARYGCSKAQIKFNNFIDYDGENVVTVEFDVNGTEATIRANGQAVAFIEFGAGVYYNGLAGKYPIPTPPEIVGIGEYGHGLGKRKAWGYYQEDGNLVITHGNPPAMAMYNTIVELEEEIGDIAREVLRS